MTTEAYLSVSAQHPEGSKANRKSILSPLPEDLDEDGEPQNDIDHPEFDVVFVEGEEPDPQFFLTEDKIGDGEDLGCLDSEGEGGVDGVDGVEGQSDNSVGEQRNISDDELFGEDFCSDDGISEESRDEDYETDLEVDEEKWLHPERFDRDLTGRSKYIKLCEDMGISPTSYFVKHIQDRELKMNFHGLGPQRMKAMAVSLQTNTNIEVLNLEGNAIDADGAICLTKVLKENYFITELVLAENSLGTDGANCLSQMLINNKNLYKIDLTANSIGDGAAQRFYDVLINNKLLKTLLLGNNCFEDTGAKLFKAAMSDNTTLEVLDLSWNHFKTRGAVMLAEGVQENVGLKSFNMAMAGLGKDGAVAIAKALKENRTLLELDISLNRINVSGAQCVAQGVRENDTLRTLKCGSNPFDSEGAYVILEAIEQNDVSEISTVDFSNIMVKIKFARLQFKLQEVRGIKVISEGVIPEFTRTNSARLTAFRVDPISAFKMYAEAAGVDLGELLVDGLDEGYCIDRKEFSTALQNSEIDVSEEQVAIIARKLNSGGKVNCRSLFDIDENEDRDQTTERSENTMTFNRPSAAGRTAVK